MSKKISKSTEALLILIAITAIFYSQKITISAQLNDLSKSTNLPALFTQSPPQCQCLSNSSQDFIPKFTRDTVNTLMSTRLIHLVQRLSIILDQEFNVKNNVASFIPEGEVISLNIYKIFGKVTIGQILTQLGVSETVNPIMAFVQNNKQTPFIDLIFNQTDIPELNMIYQAVQSLTLEKVLNLAAYDISLVKILNDFGLGSFFSPTLSIQALSDKNFITTAMQLFSSLSGSPIDLSTLTLEQIANFANMSFIFDPTFNLQTLVNTPLSELAGISGLTFEDALTSLNLTFLLSPEFNLSILVESTLNQLIDQLNLIPVFQTPISDLYRQLNISLNLSDISMTNITVIELFEKILGQNTTAVQFARMTLREIYTLPLPFDELPFSLIFLSRLEINNLLNSLAFGYDFNNLINSLTGFDDNLLLNNFTNQTFSNEIFRFLNLTESIKNETTIADIFGLLNMTYLLTPIDLNTNFLDLASTLVFNVSISNKKISSLIPPELSAIISTIQVNQTDMNLFDLVKTFTGIDTNTTNIKTIINSYNLTHVFTFLQTLQESRNSTLLTILFGEQFPQITSNQFLASYNISTDLIEQLSTFQAMANVTLTTLFQNQGLNITLNSIAMSLNMTVVLDQISFLQNNPNITLLNLLAHYKIFDFNSYKQLKLVDVISYLNLTDYFKQVTQLNLHTLLQAVDMSESFDKISGYSSITVGQILQAYNLTYLNTRDVAEVTLIQFLSFFNLSETVVGSLYFITDNSEMSLTDLIAKLALNIDQGLETIQMLRVVDVLNMFNLTENVLPSIINTLKITSMFYETYLLPSFDPLLLSILPETVFNFLNGTNLVIGAQINQYIETINTFSEMTLSQAASMFFGLEDSLNIKFLIKFFNLLVDFDLTTIFNSILGSLVSFVFKLIPPPCICTITTPAITTTKLPDDIFLLADKRIVFILSVLYPNLNQIELASLAANQSNYILLLDELTANEWKNEGCDLAETYFKFLEDQLVINEDDTLVTYDRINPLLPCKRDCQFNRFLSIPSNFSNNTVAFAQNALKLLKPEVNCRLMFGKILTPPSNADDLIKNLNQITLLTPSSLNNFSAADSLNIAKALSSSNRTLHKTLANSLGANIPTNVSATEVLSIASSVPLECFIIADSSLLAKGLSQMDIENMDDFRKSFIASSIIKSNSADTIKELLKNTADLTLINAIPANLFSQLNIDHSDIPAKRLPKSFLKKFSEDTLANKSLENISDLDTLSKILAGITADDLNEISNEKRWMSIVNIMNASLISGIEVSSLQRAVMLQGLLVSLSANTSSQVASVNLAFLTKEQTNVLYPLFIEASEEILTAFSTLPTFIELVKSAVAIKGAKCCEYPRYSRKVFAKYALQALTTNPLLTYSNLLALGDCFSTVLPLNFFQSVNETDFINYYPNIALTFQPDSNETKSTIAKISALADQQTEETIANFVFSDLKNLGLYYSKFLDLNATEFKNNGADLLNTIKLNRDPENSDVQMCRFGLENDMSVQTEINSVQTSFVNAYISTLSSGSRRRRSVKSTLTCDDLNNLFGSLKSLSTSQLNVETSVFTSCQQLLGSASNGWSTEQLLVLVGVAKEVYPGGLEVLSDSQIASLNSILLGFSSSELAKLNFGQLSSISALGALNDWTADQLVNGLGVSAAKYIDTKGGVLTSDIINSMNNLVCGLNTAYVNAVNTTEFNSAVLVLSKLSVTCPNIASWYSLAKKSSTYGSNLYTSSSAVSELGSIMAGISVSDLSQLPNNVMSSLTANVWNLMAVATVNSLTTGQLKGLTNTQVANIMRSPNYSQLSTAIRVYCESVAYPDRSVNIVDPIVEPDAKPNSGHAVFGDWSSIRFFTTLAVNLFGYTFFNFIF